MSVDAQHLQDILNFINIIWSGPFQIIVAMVFLYLKLGNSVFAGVGLMVFLIPVNGFLAQKAFRLQVGWKTHFFELLDNFSDF